MRSVAELMHATQLAGIERLCAASRPGPWRAEWTDRIGPCPRLVITAADGVHLGDWEADEDERTSCTDPTLLLTLHAPADLAWGCDLLRRAERDGVHPLTAAQRQRLAQITHRLRASRVSDWLLDYCHDDIPGGDVRFTCADTFTSVRWYPGDTSVPSFMRDSCADPHVVLIAAGPRDLDWVTRLILTMHTTEHVTRGTSVRAALFGSRGGMHAA